MSKTTESSSSPERGEPRERIAQYRLEGVISRGEHSVFYRAYDETLERSVALKVIDDPTQASRLIQEARTTSRLSHPAIAAVHQAGLDEPTGYAFVAFEWVDGITLRSRLHADASFATDELFRWIARIAEAVAYAHGQGLTHGDLKPENIVLTAGDERLKLIDFGLSGVLQGVAEDEIWGTPAYMAPELFEGAPRTAKTDLFALGVLIYELATGRLPFGGADGDPATVRAAQADEFLRPSELRPELSPAVDRVVESLLEFDPGERGPSAGEVAEWAASRFHEPRRGRRGLVATIVVLAGLAVWWQFRTVDGPPEVARRDPASGPVRLGPVEIGLGTWTIEGGDDEIESRWRDYLTLFLAGEDPGSAILEPRTGDLRLEGECSELDSGLSATFRLVRFADGRDVIYGTEVQGANHAELAFAVLEALRDRPEFELNDSGGALVRYEPALDSFLTGVRATGERRWRAARRALVEAVDASGDFLEARAWKIAVESVLGELPGAGADLALLRASSTPLARVLRGRFARPVASRPLRWGRSHPLAVELDLLIDVLDPRTLDSVLVPLLEMEERAPNPRYPATLARIYRLRGESESLRRAQERYVFWVSDSQDWRRRFFEWELEHGGLSVGDKRNQLFRWIVRRSREPVAFLAMPLFFLDSDLEGAVDIASDSTAQFGAAIETRALTLGIAGRRAEALELARGLQPIDDPSLGLRISSAIAMLDGDFEAAREFLEGARSLDPERPEIADLLGFITRDPFAQPLEAQPESELQRWRRRLGSLGAGRRARLEGEIESAESLLASLRWVDPSYRLIRWPELPLFAMLERAQCRLDAADHEGAKNILEEFRGWWPEGRAPSARVSLEAESLVSRLRAEDPNSR